MPGFHGKFCWYELTTSDKTAAESFYRDVLGWSAQDMNGPHGTYTILSASEIPLGGMMAMPSDACAAGARPGWGAYIAVDDVDDYAARVKQAGGALLHGPADIPGIARFAVVADPDGAVFNLIKGFSAEPPKVPTPGTPGHAGWRELTPAMDRRHSLFTRACSAGPRASRSTWGRWAPTSCSRSTACRPAA